MASLFSNLHIYVYYYTIHIDYRTVWLKYSLSLCFLQFLVKFPKFLGQFGQATLNQNLKERGFIDWKKIEYTLIRFKIVFGNQSVTLYTLFIDWSTLNTFCRNKSWHEMSSFSIFRYPQTCFTLTPKSMVINRKTKFCTAHAHFSSVWMSRIKIKLSLNYRSADFIFHFHTKHEHN